MRTFVLTVLFAFAFALPAHAATTTVTQSHKLFDQDEITIKTGDTVVWKNADDVTHNIQITDSDGNNTDKGLQKPGQDITYTFTKAGEYKIHCKIHPSMKMKVIVQ